MPMERRGASPQIKSMKIKIDAPKGKFVIRDLFGDRGINIKVKGCGEHNQVQMMKHNLPVKKIVRILVASRMELNYSMEDILAIKKWLKYVRKLNLKAEYIQEGIEVELNNDSLTFNINGVFDIERLH